MKSALTNLQAPMELLGSSQGWSVVDPGTILTRLWYFDGKFLSADGFRLDQQYVRSLVALSNQAVGTGVVHGFDARLGSGDNIDVDGGLALAPSGRVVYLPQLTSVPTAQLIARSSGDLFDPSEVHAAGTADFSRCAPDDPTGPDDTGGSGELWLLTVAATEALCGEEERFGQLCENACATESDRSVAVEGVLFRVHELALDLPGSDRVSLDGNHLRSRVASAYFEAERHKVPSRINGSGIRSDVWCAGADGIGGEEVPLAVFHRSGGVTSWLDMWSGRRELMESTPHRYWARRFAMRPLDVFLAQVLQFQCQLLGIGDDGPGLGGDPCADERAALVAANSVLAGLLAPSGESPESAEETVLEEVVVTGLRADLPAATAFQNKALVQLAELNTLIGNALLGKTPSLTGSVLLDGGIVETPSGGYLPVDPNKSVEAQVRAYFGPGVDLRFCAVRPDFIPEALQEAQHMERISLTQGIDDPDDLEEVDVLVPGGRFEDVAPADTTAFEGTIRILPDASGENEPLFEAKAFAREHAGDEWSWSAVAFSGVGDEFTPQNLTTVVSSRVTAMRSEEAEEDADREDEGTDGVPPTVRMRVDGEDDTPSEEAVAEAIERLRSSAAGARVFEPERDLRLLGRRRRVHRVFFDRRASTAAPEGETRQPVGERGVFVGERPDFRRGDAAVYGWLDFRIGTDLTTLSIGDQATATATAVGFAELGDRTGLADFAFNGTLQITDIQSTTVSGGAGGVRVSTTLSGGMNYFVDNTGDVDSGFEDAAGITIEWILATLVGGRKVVQAIAVRQSGSARGDDALLLEFGDIGSPRRIEGRLRVRAAKQSEAALVGRGDLTLADTELTEHHGALDPGSTGRDVGEAVIGVLAAQLAARQRRPGFESAAAARLFALDAGSGRTSSLASVTDWVMFHRRRTKVCSGASEPNTPPARRRYRWYHTEGDPELVAAIRRALSPKTDDETRAAIFEEIPFTLIATVEFEEHSSRMLTAAVGLRADFEQRASDTDRIVAVTTTESPTGDGEAIAKSRTIATLQTLASTVDVSQAEARVIVGIPPEFQTPGVDGVIFTVGMADAVVEETPIVTARVVRISEESIDLLESQQGTVEEQVVQRQFAERGFRFDVATVRFSGTDLLDPDIVSELAAGGVVPGLTFIGYDATFAQTATDTDLAVWSERRAPVLTLAMGGDSSPASRLAADFVLTDSEAIIFIA